MVKAISVDRLITDERDPCIVDDIAFPPKPFEFYRYFDVKIVYVPSEKMIVIGDGWIEPPYGYYRDRILPEGTLFGNDNYHKRYTVFIGEKATAYYDELLEKFSALHKKNISVSETFLEWARLLYAVGEIPDDVKTVLI